MKIVITILLAINCLSQSKRQEPVLPYRIPVTSLNTSVSACDSPSHIEEEVSKIKNILQTKRLSHPCDCGGIEWERVAYYDFSQQECPPEFTRQYGRWNNTSCQPKNNEYGTCKGWIYHASSLELRVEGKSYSSVCGRVRGHGHGTAFNYPFKCNAISLESGYVEQEPHLDLCSCMG